MLEFNDKPIDSPDNDKFGFNSLAEAIADSISKMKRPEGTVIAINGPWGSGKSSFINLVRHHLDNSSENDELTIVDFKCWWFRGEEALTIAFFRELYSAMESSGGESDGRAAKETVAKIGAQLLRTVNPLAGAILNVTSGPHVSEIVSTLMGSIGDFIERDETVEKLHKKLSDALSEDPRRRYLIIIDDIDRLSPDEAMLIFRLVKSVGGLPNVMYLLAYDRQLAEKIVTERYPSEGQHYLEKIVQASFDLPEPTRLVLRNAYVDRTFQRIHEGNTSFNVARFAPLLDALITPELKTPRDLLKILNPLMVTWSAVEDSIDIVDFLCIETLRVKRPELYYALRSNKDLLTKVESNDQAMERGYHSAPPNEDSESQPYKHPQAETYEDIFLNREPETERERLRRGLMLLFPTLARTWSPSNYRDDDPDTWERQRRICSPKHFDTYFRFALQDDVLSSGEIKELIASTGNPESIRQSLLDASQRKLPNGGTRAGLLLDALKVDANEIANNNVRSLLNAIYSIADALIIESEETFKSDNMLQRLDYLTETLTMQRFSLEERSEVLLEACAKATLTYLMRIATWAYSQHFPENNATRIFRHIFLTTRDHADKLNNIAITRIREAATDGSLHDVPYLGDVLLWWIKNADDEKRIRSWVSNVYENNVEVAHLAKAFISLTHYRDSQQSLEDYWEKELGRVVELGEFRSRANQVVRDENLGGEERNVLRKFLDAF